MQSFAYQSTCTSDFICQYALIASRFSNTTMLRKRLKDITAAACKRRFSSTTWALVLNISSQMYSKMSSHCTQV